MNTVFAFQIFDSIYEKPRIAKVLEIESRIVARSGGRGEWGMAVEWAWSFSFAR